MFFSSPSDPFQGRHTVTRIVPYAPETLFDLVADVGRYPEFIPWCAAARAPTPGAEPTPFHADLTISHFGLRETFSSLVTPAADKSGLHIEASGRTLSRLDGLWRFEGRDGGEAAEVTLTLRWAFRFRFLDYLAAGKIAEMAPAFCDAFENRAAATATPRATPR